MSDLVTRLRAAGSVFAEEEAALLENAADDATHLEAMVTRRLAGHPLEQVVGWVDFAGVRVQLSAGVFVPRQRTALVAELAAADSPQAGLVIDLCTGSGALLAAVLARRQDLVGHAADLDPVAVACARRNLDATRASVHQGDLYDALPAHLRGRVDVLMVNAPYVPSDEIAFLPPEARDHEPRLALDGGLDGLDVHRRVALEAGTWLVPGGVLLIEVSHDQLPVATDLMKAAGLVPETVADDERGALVMRSFRPRAPG